MSAGGAHPQRLQALIDLLTEGVAVFDADGALVLANPAFWRICGLDPAQGTPRLDAPGWSAVDEHGAPLPLDEWPARVALRERRAVTGRRVGLHRPDGSVAWLSISAAPAPDGDAGPEVIVSLIDVTAEHGARAALRESHDLLRDVIDGISDAVAFRDREGRYRAVNDTFCAWTGVTREEILGRTADDVVAPPWRRDAHEAFARMEATLAPFVVEVSDPESDRVWRVARTPHVDREGRFAGVVAIAAEITEYRRMERTLTAANEDLERRVAARTRELELAAAELEAFTYRVSHDLRAPLRAIRGFAEGLASDLGPSAPPDLLRIEEGAAAMTSLIDALLELSHAGRRAGRLDRVDAALGRIAAEAREEVAADARARSVAIVLGDLPEWFVDPVLMRQVFVNLLGNAIKFSRPEGGTVRVEAERAGEDLVVTVTDDGVGFGESCPAPSFGPFARLPNARGLPGAGIGLAIVERVVTAHGGRVRAEPGPGGGARFSFSLPSPEA